MSLRIPESVADMFIFLSYMHNTYNDYYLICVSIFYYLSIWIYPLQEFIEDYLLRTIILYSDLSNKVFANKDCYECI